ncbi:DUF732 domain-containing protein [Tsukamurella soli]
MVRLHTAAQPRFRRALGVAALAGAIALGATACGGSSTVTAPTAPDLSGGGTASAGPTTLPATGPSSTAAPSGFPGESATPMSAKEKAFVATIRGAGINAPDDVVVLAGNYVCSSVAANPKSSNLEIMIKAMLGPGQTDEQATADAKTLIAKAESGYCKK